MKKIIYHKDLPYYLDKLTKEKEFQCGSTNKESDRYYCPTEKEWYRERVKLEFPLGEMCKDALNTLALTGKREVKVLPIKGDEKFNAHGIEGKGQVEMDLFSALMKMRDILPIWRGRILVDN